MATIPLYIGLFLLKDINSIKNNFLTFNWIYLLYSLSIIFLSQTVRAIRWHFWIKKISENIPIKYNFLSYFSGLALMITPGRMGEAIKSIYVKRDYNLSISSTAPLVIIERLYEIIGIVVLSSLSFYFTKFNTMQILIPFLAVLFIIVITQKKKALFFFLNILKKVPLLSRILPNLTESLETFYIMLHFKKLIPYSLISIFAVLLDMIGIFYLIIGLNIPLNFAESVLIISSSVLIGFLSFLPGGLIAMEGSFIGFLSVKGIQYSSIIVFLILFRIVSTIFLTSIGMIALRKISKKQRTEI